MKRVIVGGMTDAEVEDAILNGKPYDLDSFRRYRWSDSGQQFRQNAVMPSEIQVGKPYINTEDASEFDLGTKFTVLDIANPKTFEDLDEHSGKWESRFDYVFKVKDENGHVFNIHYDDDEYVGVEV